MTEIQDKNNGGKEKRRQKKMNVFVDFTPMVDMNMLLITFFMLCTTLNRLQTMEISMPDKTKVGEEQQNKVRASQAMTFILGANDKVFYYQGEPDYNDCTSLKTTDYSPQGMRTLLLERNRQAIMAINRLKKQKADMEITEEEYIRKVSEIKNGKDVPVVIIKAADLSKYRNLVDALDEMQICGIGKYAVVDMTEGDESLLKNYETSGGLLSRQSGCAGSNV